MSTRVVDLSMLRLGQENAQQCSDRSLLLGLALFKNLSYSSASFLILGNTDDATGCIV